MSLITFYIQKVLNKLTHYPPQQPLGKLLHTFSNGFLQQGSSDPLQCVLQLGNSFGYSSFCGYCKPQRCGL